MAFSNNGEKTKLEWWKFRNLRSGYLDSYGMKILGAIRLSKNPLWANFEKVDSAVSPSEKIEIESLKN